MKAAIVIATLPVMGMAGWGFPIESIRTSISASASSAGPAIPSLGTARSAASGVRASPMATAPARRILSSTESFSVIAVPAHSACGSPARPAVSGDRMTAGAPASTIETG
ncbi:hypothetical protein ACZ91_13620 [Streptomyces regensis]|nr:hypothetical protein ACZ91_13620 [Streptomyces regensis]